MKAVILCGGRGTRLAPLTDHLPKSLVEVAGRPFIFWQLDLFANAGIQNIVLCCGFLGEMIQNVVGYEYHGLLIDYVFDGDQPLGTAGALRKALPLLGNAFFVLYGDTYLPSCDYRAVQVAFLMQSRPALLTYVRNENSHYKNNVYSRGSYIYYDKKNRSIPSTWKHIDYGLSVMSPAAFTKHQFNDLADVYHSLGRYKRLAGYEMKERLYEIGSPEGLAEFRTFAEGKR